MYMFSSFEGLINEKNNKRFVFIALYLQHTAHYVYMYVSLSMF